ncbi:phosphotransferase family protein [Deinococcus sp.]|uniref:phosphotransferase family protein n=1 Tax=Deinococcus sp. TaxID=47478 RepID=UPI003CC5F5F4
MTHEEGSGAVLPERIRRWIEEQAGPGAAILSAQELVGGTSATLHAVSLRVGGDVQELVIRQFDRLDWLRLEPDLARHEAAALAWAARTGVPTPRLIAYEERAEVCGVPLVLMSRLPGAVNLRPADLSGWLDAQAAALAQIHRTDPGGLDWADLDWADLAWEHFSYSDPASQTPPRWSGVPDAWERALHLVRGPRPAYTPRFIHRDYHPANVLWQGGRLSGVVDWVNACRGPAGADVGHCRVNLAQLFGTLAADEFLSAYRRQAGMAFEYEPFWDILSLTDILTDELAVYAGWWAFGVRDLSGPLIGERLDAYLLSLLERTA